MDCLTPSNICYLRALKLYGFPELHLIVMHEYDLLIHFLKKIKKHGSKYRSIMFSLQKTWGNYFNVLNVGADTENNFIKFFSLHWARAVHKKVLFFLHDLFFAWWLHCLHAQHDAIVSKLCFYVYATFLTIFSCWHFCFNSMFLDAFILYMLLWWYTFISNFLIFVVLFLVLLIVVFVCV